MLELHKVCYIRQQEINEKLISILRFVVNDQRLRVKFVSVHQVNVNHMNYHKVNRKVQGQVLLGKFQYRPNKRD